MVKKERSSNFELMRIVSMLFIILYHAITYTNLDSNCQSVPIRLFIQMILYIIIVHVNSFVLLSGYFQSKSKFRLSKLINMLVLVSWYSFLILFIGIKLGWVEEYSIITFVNSLLPSNTSIYWFINCYLLVYIFSDYINKFINRLSQSEYKRLIVIYFLVFSVLPFCSGLKFYRNDGFTFTNFFLLYIIGGYLRRFPLKESYHFKNYSTNGYRIILMLFFAMMAFSNFMLNNFASQVNGVSNLFTELSSRISGTRLLYSNPFIILQCIAYFEFFGTFKFKNKVVNWVASSTFGIYLIHDNPAFKMKIYKLMHVSANHIYSYKRFIWMFCAVLIIFIISLFIDKIRVLINRLFIKIPVIKKIMLKIRMFIGSFNFKINI